MNKKKNLIIIILLILLVGIICFATYKYTRKGTVVCTKTLLEEKNHTVSMNLSIKFNNSKIEDYTAETIYDIKNEETYNELFMKLPYCDDNYKKNGTIVCKVNEYGPTRKYTLTRKYKNYVKDLKGQKFTCVKHYR